MINREARIRVFFRHDIPKDIRKRDEPARTLPTYSLKLTPGLNWKRFSDLDKHQVEPEPGKVGVMGADELPGGFAGTELVRKTSSYKALEQWLEMGTDSEVRKAIKRRLAERNGGVPRDREDDDGMV